MRYFVIHTTEGHDSRTWLTKTGGVSANDLIRPQDGTVYELVPWHRGAWHAGRISGTPTTPLYQGHIVGWDDFGNAVWSVNPNSETFGIEVEGFAANLMPQSTLELVVERIRDRQRILGPLPLVGHFELSPGDRSDPGRQNLAALKALLEEDMTPEQDTRLKNIEATLAALVNQQSALAVNIPATWLRRMFYGLNPLTGKRRGVNETVPPELVVPE